MKQFTIIILLLTAPVFAFAKGDPKSKTNGAQALREHKKMAAAPDIPGNFIIDLGFNLLSSKAKEVQRKFWGSKSVALSYTLNINPPKTFFSVNTGISLALEKYALKNNTVLTAVTDNVLGQVSVIDTLSSNIEVKKSKIITNYVEIPLELRVYTNQADRERGLFIAIGISAGILYQSNTKLVSKTDGVKSKVKNKADFGFNLFRARGIVRVGYRGFNVFYKLGITEWFQKGKGPAGAPSKMSTFGISFVGF